MEKPLHWVGIVQINPVPSLANPYERRAEILAAIPPDVVSSPGITWRSYGAVCVDTAAPVNAITVVTGMVVRQLGCAVLLIRSDKAIAVEIFKGCVCVDAAKFIRAWLHGTAQGDIDGIANSIWIPLSRHNFGGTVFTILDPPRHTSPEVCTQVDRVGAGNTCGSCCTADGVYMQQTKAQRQHLGHQEQLKMHF